VFVIAGTVVLCITQNWWYSAVHYFWPVEELAELADGPAGCGEVANGGCSFAWNCAYVVGQLSSRTLLSDHVRRPRRIVDQTLH